MGTSVSPCPEANQLQHSGGATLVSAGADALKVGRYSLTL
jgi:hypothetical protein